MYTLESLYSKTFKELKDIGRELNVLPAGDRRCRQNWIDALVGVNPPLLQLLEASPVSEVETVQEAIETSSGAQIDPVQEPPLESKFGRILYPKPAKIEPKMSQSAIAQAAKNSPGVNFPHPKNPYPGYSYKLVREPETPGYSGWLRTLPFPQLKKFAAERNVFSQSENPEDWIEVILSLWKDSDSCVNPPLVDSEGFALGWVVNTDEDFKNYTEVDRPPNRGENGRDRLENEAKMSQSAIELAAKKSLDVKPDLNPILTAADSWNPAEFGEVLHTAELSGQMNLLQWDVNEPPEPDDFHLMTDFHAAYDRWLLSSELHEIIHAKNDPPTTARTGTRCDGASEVSRDNSASPECNICSQHDGASLPIQNHSLGSQEGDRILEVARHDSGDSGRVISHQPTQLGAPIITPQAPIITPPYNEQRPPGRGDGRGDYVELAIGMLVGRRRDRQHLGKIINIYRSRRGIWRAKIQPINKSNFVYFDCAALIEQRLLYDHQINPGGFISTGSVFDKSKGEKLEVYSRKVRSPKPTNWTPEQLFELSTFKLKQIAREMEIPAIPGRAGKRSLIRAILAEQAISQEKAAAQIEKEASRTTAQKQKSAPASKKRAAASPLGNQLSLFDVVA